MQNAWEVDPELTKVYGTKCREVEIILLDDDLDNVFETKLAWFTTSQCVCFGNGDTATRRTKEFPDGQPWTPCGKSCPDLTNGSCKPSADLRFMLAAFPKLGSVARIHTGSYRSIMQISSSIQQIQTITGGRLAGIRCKLVVRPEKTSYEGSDNKRHSTTIYALNLEIQADGIQELIGKMTDHARLFEQTRKMLGTGRIEVIEEDDDRAPEIHPEFYPASSIAPVQFPKPDEVEAVVEPKQQPNMDVMCNDCRKVNGHEPDCKHATKPKAQKKAESPKPAEATKAAEPSIYMVASAAKKTSKAKGDYLFLSVMDPIGNAGVLYVWHASLFDLFLSRTYEKPLAMMCVVSEQEAPGGKRFFQVEKLMELGGHMFVDGKPAVEADPVDDSNPFAED
jgi:hypothetical protein